ncbi:penicillin acylase family protein [Cytobacillus sp. FSL W7-1323]|uniref:Penicillin acylase family protein n=2 Tax=Cytobacillus TaxID=2675230 RepID=A0A248TEK7_9BACI|nr:MULTISPECIES: penicillin acylase family protein [Cytobacillus]ASV66635.1 penicillin acylase family protein [Cytobacillus kochii]MBD7938403.1 penicillin acylase family protein [Cytobacillus stercorigallinarum]MDQ0188051.1 penicillin amidase [Cytobacillus kochii]MEA1854218.1 penicillin acylase family protein [Cytobacillus sp. OWB-43]MED1607161.1 penicillin acylase family protein [Cytobacillus kochii]
MEIKTEAKKNVRWKRLLLWMGGSLLGLILLVIIGAYYFLNRPLPQVNGDIQLKGLQQAVEVVRDEMGVPHIEATNEYDLYFSQGYVQAQDRLFQMDLSRRQASGRLSEVIGESTVDTDKYFRTLGLRRAAEESVAEYSDEGMRVLNAFADGVNAYIEELHTTGKWPIEFTILGYKPEAWKPIDSLTIGKYMAFDLGGHWKDQAFRQYLLQTFPEEKAYDLFPTYPEEAPTIITKEQLDFSTAFAQAVIPHEFNGSNNWVVSGDKTATGKSLLADDPHLGLATPSVWYQMHLQSDEVNVGGVIFAGVPGIILGHNENIAWGVTNTGPDVQDLYIEKRNPEDPHLFLYNDKWEKAQVIAEPIKVKDSETIDYEVIETRHGPIISEFAADAATSETALSLQWTALEATTELEAILNMNHAENWKEFEEALAAFEAPAQNFVFTDREGNIAYKANGKIPIRKKGNGLLPVPGWTDEYAWEGAIPYDELPTIVNPEEGFISTANNKVVGDDYRYHISHNWAQPYRQMRIQEVLSGSNKLTAENMMELQMDEKNLQAEEFVPVMLKQLANEKGENIQSALDILSKWDYQDHQDLAAPYIFNRWMVEIGEALFEEQIPKETLELFGGKRSAVDQLLRNAFAGNPGPWVKDVGGINELLVVSLTETLSQIQEDEGGDMANWNWGDYHQVSFTHPLSSVAPLNYLFNYQGSMATGGSAVTVKAAAFKNDGTVNHGASWRFVMDMNNPMQAYHIVGPGQSGHVSSDWYQNQMADWVEGDYHKTTLGEPEGKRLLLTPEE